MQTLGHVIDGQVAIARVEKYGFDLSEQLLAVLANEPIVILVLNVNDEVEVVGDGGAAQSTDRVDSDFALELLLFYVG